MSEYILPCRLLFGSMELFLNIWAAMYIKMEHVVPYVNTAHKQVFAIIDKNK